MFLPGGRLLRRLTTRLGQQTERLESCQVTSWLASPRTTQVLDSTPEAADERAHGVRLATAGESKVRARLLGEIHDDRPVRAREPLAGRPVERLEELGFDLGATDGAAAGVLTIAAALAGAWDGGNLVVEGLERVWRHGVIS